MSSRFQAARGPGREGEDTRPTRASTLKDWIDGVIRRCEAADAPADREAPAHLRRFQDRAALLDKIHSGVDAPPDQVGEVLIHEAESEIERCSTGRQRDRGAAFALLTADAAITAACLWAVSRDDDPEELAEWLDRTTARVAGAGWRS